MYTHGGRETYDVEKDEYYEKLYIIINKCREHDINILIGDLNSKIGKEAKYLATIGTESLHT